MFSEMSIAVAHLWGTPPLLHYKKPSWEGKGTNHQTTRNLNWFRNCVLPFSAHSPWVRRWGSDSGLQFILARVHYERPTEQGPPSIHCHALTQKPLELLGKIPSWLRWSFCHKAEREFEIETSLSQKRNASSYFIPLILCWELTQLQVNEDNDAESPFLTRIMGENALFASTWWNAAQCNRYVLSVMSPLAPFQITTWWVSCTVKSILGTISMWHFASLIAIST